MSEVLRDHGRRIWHAAVDAVRPEPLIRGAMADLADVLSAAPRILVLGAGKAGAAMAQAVEVALADQLDRVEGIVNVPADTLRSLTQPARQLQKIKLHPARPPATNFPTKEGVAGAQEMLRLAQTAGPEDVGLCLLSGGGSALLPAPAEGITLEDKLSVTKLLHQCGATINEMNAVRKHLSAIKGGLLAQAFKGNALYSLIISDVIGDPLDVIASGPTAPDASTFADALAILDRHHLLDKVSAIVLEHLREGAAGRVPETPKALPAHIHNQILCNNEDALAAAEACASGLGYNVLNLGSDITGETKEVAIKAAGLIGTMRTAGLPTCILGGGETTVTLPNNPGKGGRNQEFVLATIVSLAGKNSFGLPSTVGDNVVVLSGGTDGEDGPTDAAGAIADAGTLQRAGSLGLDPRDFLDRHDAYHFFRATGDLLITGLTQTNVMDVRVLLMAAN